MQISNEKSANIITKILAFLQRRKIKSLGDLDKILDKKFNTSDGNITVSIRPSNCGQAHTITYAIEGSGLPVEIRINKNMNYSKIIMKGNFYLENYEPECTDAFGNTIQIREFKYTGIPQIKSELKKARTELENLIC